MSDYTDKDTFKARWGSGDHLDKLIRDDAPEPMIRLALRNPVFDEEHHAAMMRSKTPYIRSLAANSPHVTPDDLKDLMHSGHDKSHSGMNSAMQHPRARIEDVKKVAFEHPNPMVVGAAVRIVHTKKGGWTPEELGRIGNRTFDERHNKTGMDTMPPNLAPIAREHLNVVPMHILNSTLPKDHPPLTNQEVHNHVVAHRGGTLI